MKIRQYLRLRRIRSLRIALTFFVFATMTASGMLAGILFMAVRHFTQISVKAMSSLIPISLITTSIVLGTLIFAVISRRFLQPIRRLSTAMEAVARGDFSVRVPVSGALGELTQLQQSFNSMAEDLSGIEVFRNDFIDSFSHEFKTPIVSIRGFARQLERDSLSDTQRREYIDIIVRESERLSQLSTNVLLLSRLENQRILTGKTDFFLDEQIRGCILLLEKAWSEKNIEFDLEMDEVRYFSNEDLLSQVWVNLLSNAIKFSHPEGVITIRCAQSEESAVITIADNGIGMDPQTVEHVFDKFYQGDSSRASLGNGIGLSIVKRIVDLCGGEVQLTSALGRGSCFTIALPL